MIIKSANDQQSQLSTLKNLLTHPDADETKKKRIEQEIRNIYAGIRAEKEAAYEMKVHYGESKNWMIINDLRIEHGGLVAQIDHLIINRFLEIWVCESKHFSEGIEINEHGEFSAFFDSKPYGVPSPIEQNNKHILILERLFDAKTIKLPTRLGLTIKPKLKSLVLVSKNARIIRPKVKIDGLDYIIKNDHLFKTIKKTLNDTKNPFPSLAKIVSQNTLEALAKEISKLHKPTQYNWQERFGLSSPITVVQTQKPSIPETLQSITTTEETQKPSKKFNCYSCGETISERVSDFCKSRKLTFSGNAYCMECQKRF